MGQNDNEWIRHTQPYVKIPVGHDGIYRVSFESLESAGFAVGSDPGHFQLFHRGIEQAIHVQGESDGVFGAGDYIEFYGRRNDGTLDSTLYADPAFQPHRYYNLFSDTAAYFLTVGTSVGRRMAIHESSADGLTPVAFHRAEKLLVLTQSYSTGIDYGNIQKTEFDLGEGWMGPQILHGQEATYVIEGIVDAVPASGKPHLEILLTGRGPMSHEVQLSAGTRLLSTVTFAGFASYNFAQDIEWSDVESDGKLHIKVRVTGAGGPDRVSVGYIRVAFPQRTNMAAAAEKLFSLDAGAEALLSIQNATTGTQLFDVTDPSAPVRITAEQTSTLDAVIAAADVPRNILVTSQFFTPSPVRVVKFRQIDPAQHNYVIVTHPSLRKPALGYIDPVKAFAEYRSLPEGGGFDTLVVNIDQLYDQFNYGEVSPRAIYQFMKYCASVKLPDFLFLIGKGLDVNYGYWRNPSAFTVYRDLVPTAGYPASDMTFTAGLQGLDHVPAVATGRLSASTPADVAAYLNKMKQRDAQPYNDLNRKKILHLSGGIEEEEPRVFRQILESFQTIAEDLYLGGRVQAIAKQSTNIKLINIAEEVNRGVGLITFFGHSAPNTLDFDIGHVSDPVMGYNNSGKYPFMLMNGCDAGSYFLNTEIIGEDWINTPDKGAIGMIAHSSYGLVYGLQVYSSILYQVAFGDSTFLKKGVGDVQREVARRFLQIYGASPLYISQAQQMVLLGDPAIPLFGAHRPDYAPVLEGIAISSFTDEPITAFSDSFRIQIPIRNYGIARPENIRVNIQRTSGGGSVVEYDTIIASVLFEDTVRMTLRNSGRDGFGLNTFIITVDADDLISEMAENNNAVAFEYFIPLNSTRNLFPYNYSIVNTPETNLSFQFTDPLSGPRDFLLEIDTSRHFNSPWKKQYAINAQVLARQPVELLEQDSLVYFWRTRIADPLENESRDWTLSSFTYIDDGPEGWAQVRFDQYENNSVFGLVPDPEMRRIEFRETVSDIAVRTFTASAGKPLDSISLKINGVEFNLLYEGGACRNNTINFVAFDRRSTQPYAGIYFKWYELLYNYGGRRLLCGREPYVINSFTPQELWTGNNDDLDRYVDNIAEGDTVVLFNMGDAGYSQWSAPARTKLGELGISTAQLDVLENGDAVVIFGRKGAPAGTAQVYHVSSPGTKAEVKRTIAGRFTAGSLSSGRIGPAHRWDRFISRVAEVEGPDEFRFSIVGVRSDGGEDTLRNDIQGAADLSFIDAGAYPYVRVVFETSDNIDLTAVQLAKWFVLYDPLAEGMVVFRGSSSQLAVAEGETVHADFGFINVSDKPFPDSVTVRYDLVNMVNGNSPGEMRIAPPVAGDTSVFSIQLPTVGKGGLNDLEVFVNPRIIPEKTFDNNFVRMGAFVDVMPDKARPVIEVTFDGRHIRDNELVSPNPAIVVRIWDENRLMFKKDTTGVRLFLASDCEEDDCLFEAVYFTRDDVIWHPATETSDFEVHFSPQDLPDGQYRLRVEAQDASGNAAGEAPYDIRFRVEHQPSVVVTSAYPNPFSLETNIDIIVGGERSVPVSYRIYISTAEGSVVSEIADESGLHTGHNTVRWTGRGNDGQSLPNGIYFYRLVLVDNGLRKTYYGKIVLTR